LRDSAHLSLNEARRFVLLSNPSVMADFEPKSGRVERQSVRIALFVFGQRIKTALESTKNVVRPVAERVQDAHPNFMGLGADLVLWAYLLQFLSLPYSVEVPGIEFFRPLCRRITAPILPMPQ
jgi:hypothetical protein